MLYLTKDDIQKCFSMRDAIEADKKALELYSKGKLRFLLERISIFQKKMVKICICQASLEEKVQLQE